MWLKTMLWRLVAGAGNLFGKNHEIVHVELCDFMPEPERWQERRRGKWVESRASYSVVS